MRLNLCIYKTPRNKPHTELVCYVSFDRSGRIRFRFNCKRVIILCKYWNHPSLGSECASKWEIKTFHLTSLGPTRVGLFICTCYLFLLHRRKNKHPQSYERNWSLSLEPFLLTADRSHKGGTPSPSPSSAHTLWPLLSSFNLELRCPISWHFFPADQAQLTLSRTTVSKWIIYLDAIVL